MSRSGPPSHRRGVRGSAHRTGHRTGSGGLPPVRRFPVGVAPPPQLGLLLVLLVLLLIASSAGPVGPAPGSGARGSGFAAEVGGSAVTAAPSAAPIHSPSVLGPGPLGARAPTAPSLATPFRGCTVAARSVDGCLSVSGILPAAGNATNSSPVAEVGYERADLPVGSSPAAVLLDGPRGLTYVANEGSNNVSVLVPGTPTTSVAVGTAPVALVPDGTEGWVYVLNSGSANVTLLSGASREATFPVGGGPVAGVVDPANGFLYVANANSGTVSVVNGTERVATIRVGGDPTYLALDPTRGWVYVVEPTAGVVRILNGTRVAGTLVGFSDPTGALYDPANGFVYIADSGNFQVVVLNGTSVVANRTGLSVGSMAVGPGGRVYAAEPGADRVAVLNGTSVAGVVNLTGSPGAMAYDPGNGYVYAPLYGDGFGPGTLAAIRGTTLVGSAPVSVAPEWAAFDPSGAVLAVAGTVPGAAPAGAVAWLSAMLAISAPSLDPVGNPAGSVDVGSTETLAATLWAPGNGTDRFALSAAPSSGLSCAPPTAANGSAFGTLDLGVLCVPGSPGRYVVALTVVDAGGASVGARIAIQVDPDPTTGLPVAEAGGNPAATYAYVGSTVGFSAATTGGTGSYAPLLWSGTPVGSCHVVTAVTLSCVLSAPGHFDVTAATEDSNGVGSVSPPLPFDVFRPPTIDGAPATTRTSADVGETVGFVTNGTVGTGVAPAFLWLGLPDTACSSLVAAHIDCTFSAPGTYDLSVRVSDANGRSVTGPARAFPVYPAPSVAAPPRANRSSVDVGQPFRLGAEVTGGYGSDNVTWLGLPSSCMGIAGDAPTCIAAAPGVLTVAAQATDANSVVSQPSPPLFLTVYPDPRVAAPHLSAVTVPVGGPVAATVTVSGGDGTFVLTWSGLPDGCTVSGPSVECAPTRPGAYLLAVTAQDGNGFRVLSPAAALIVTVGPAPAVPPGSGPSLPIVPIVPWLLGIAAGSLLLARAASARRRGRGRGRPGPGYEVEWDPIAPRGASAGPGPDRPRAPNGGPEAGGGARGPVRVP